MDLRCGGNKLHGIVDENVLKVKCGSRFCGAEPGVVVIHQWNLTTGVMNTKRYKDPRRKHAAR